MTPRLDQEEQLISDHLDTLTSVADVENVKKRLVSAAKGTLKRDRATTIRFTAYELELFKRKAAEEGMRYQVLVSSVLHKYITGRLVEAK